MCHRDTARSLDPLRNPSKGQTYRIVPPFSLQTLQRNTKVLSRCGFNATESRKMVSSSHRPAKITLFRMYYQRGDLPIKVEYLSGGVRVIWTVDLAKIDIGFYLPLFFDGLAETQHPYKLYARQGVKDLINYGRDKIYPIIPQLILPIKSWSHSYHTIKSDVCHPYFYLCLSIIPDALNTQNVEVICVILDILQQMVKASDLIGPALIPFYRQLLPMFNTYKAYNGKVIATN